MPKQTFFNLHEEKRHILIKAAKKEFSRAAYAEASIANIVKDAKIPRGSFYQYFEDKEDLYQYLLHEISLYRQRAFIESLIKHEGNLFHSMLDNFEFIVKELDSKKESEQFYHNVFINMDYRSGVNFFGSLERDTIGKHLNELKKYVRKDLLNIEDDEELLHMIQILMSIFIKTLVQKYVFNMSPNEVIVQFNKQMKLIRKGFERKEMTEKIEIREVER